MSVTRGIRRSSLALFATLFASAGLWVASTDVAFAAGPVVSIGSSSIYEGDAGNRTLYFNVTLSQTSASAVTVHYATSPTTATANTDYVTKSGNLTIAAGQTTNWVAIAITGDTTNEADETFKVSLSAPTNATLGPQSIGTGTIVNDDNPTSSAVQISIASASMTEGNSGNRIFWFSIALSKTRTSSTTIHYATAPVTALAGTDYTTRSADATIPAGQTSTFGNVVEMPDVYWEPSETFKVTLSAPPSGVTVKGGPAIATIVNDDFLPTNAKSWGTNAHGGLGDPSVSTDIVGTPRQVAGTYAMASTPGTLVGGQRTIAVGSDGTLWAWGDNGQGALGDGTFDDRHVPEQIGTATNWSAVSAGPAHTLALKTDGTVWAWGSDDFGALGDGNGSGSVQNPAQVGSDTDWASVSAGSDYSLAVKTDGTLWAWGYNAHGQLGTGDADTVTYHAAPTQVGTDTDWASASAGYQSAVSHSVGIKTDGTLWAWGDNTHGQLGTDFPNQHNAPTQVGTDTDWANASAAYLYTLAVKTGGTLWAWGENANGQLGDGTTTERDAPVQIGTGTDWATASAGFHHSLGVKTGGTLWAWGEDNYSQLGDGGTATKLAPQQVGTATGWSGVAAGGRSSVARKSDGTVWSFGYNGFIQLNKLGGQLGYPEWRESPGAIATAGPWKAIAAEGGGPLDLSAGSAVAIKANGTLWAWGENSSGQLGDGTTTDRAAPEQIGTVNTWTAIAGGTDDTFGVRSDGTLWAWGANNGGKLGVGGTTAHHAPTRVGTSTGWKSVAAGYDHALAIKTDGTLWAWGSNSHGQLGIGTGAGTPFQVGTLKTWKQVAAGSQYSMAIRTDGTLWAWGLNSSGQLGDGTTTERHAPKQIGTLTTWKQVNASASTTTSAAVRGDGSLWEWGSTPNGQFMAPTRVGTANDWDAVAVGTLHIVGLRANRSVWTMGVNRIGQLGNGTLTDSMTPVQAGTGYHAVQIAAGGDATYILSSL
jgi:alpha-tubulin suppressor-like RCC1 family protein